MGLCGRRLRRINAAAGSVPHLEGDRDAVAQGDDRRDHPRVLRQAFVVRPDRGRLLGLVPPGAPPGQQDVVRHEEPADPQPLDARVEDLRVAGLVDVVEDEVEGTLEVPQDRLRVADEDLDLRRDARLLEVPPRDRGGLRAVLDRDEFPALREGAREPRPGIADRGAELQDPRRADRAGEDVEEAPFGRSDDRPLLADALRLDLLERGIPAIREPADVLVDLVVDNLPRRPDHRTRETRPTPSTFGPPFRVFTRNAEASNGGLDVDKSLSPMSPESTPGMGHVQTHEDG